MCQIEILGGRPRLGPGSRPRLGPGLVCLLTNFPGQGLPGWTRAALEDTPRAVQNPTARSLKLVLTLAHETKFKLPQCAGPGANKAECTRITSIANESMRSNCICPLT